MKSIIKTSKRGIIAIFTLCILLGIAGTCLNVIAMTEDNTVATDGTTAVVAEAITITTEESAVAIEDTTATTEETTLELMPTMATRSCYDYDTVGDCMSDISSIYGFKYSLSGNSYACSGNYSVSINNSHNYLNVILSYNGSCIAMYSCSRR